jgi:hypothetical protein
MQPSRVLGLIQANKPKTGTLRGSLLPLVAPVNDDNAFVTAVVHSATSFLMQLYVLRNWHGITRGMCFCCGNTPICLAIPLCHCFRVTEQSQQHQQGFVLFWDPTNSPCTTVRHCLFALQGDDGRASAGNVLAATSQQHGTFLVVAAV